MDMAQRGLNPCFAIQALPVSTMAFVRLAEDFEAGSRVLLLGLWGGILRGDNTVSNCFGHACGRGTVVGDSGQQ